MSGAALPAGEPPARTANGLGGQVVRHAKRELIVHDDGNDRPGTIYNDERVDERVIEAIDRQMAQHEVLAVNCLFNARRFKRQFWLGKGRLQDAGRGSEA